MYLAAKVDCHRSATYLLRWAELREEGSDELLVFQSHAKPHFLGKNKVWFCIVHPATSGIFRKLVFASFLHRAHRQLQETLLKTPSFTNCECAVVYYEGRS